LGGVAPRNRGTIDNRPAPAAELWVQVHVEEAYIHCRKHIPRMQPVARDRDWGTDSATAKGGDYSGAKHTPHPDHRWK